MTDINRKYSIIVLSILSSGLLAILVPGGAIETRGFEHINPLALLTFNIFLTLLVMVSILNIYYLFRDEKWAYTVATFYGVAYFLVYILDLGQIFPVSTDPMSYTLFSIEVLGSVVSIPLIFLSIKERSIPNLRQEQTTKRQPYSKKLIYFALVLFLLSLGIIAFATKSAMGV